MCLIEVDRLCGCRRIVDRGDAALSLRGDKGERKDQKGQYAFQMLHSSDTLKNSCIDSTSILVITESGAVTATESSIMAVWATEVIL